MNAAQRYTQAAQGIKKGESRQTEFGMIIGTAKGAFMATYSEGYIQDEFDDCYQDAIQDLYDLGFKGYELTTCYN